MNRKNDALLQTAAKLACTVGYQLLTRELVAEAAGVSPATVNFRFGTMAKFRRELMRYAVRTPVLPVVAQGLAARDPHARKAPIEVREAAKGIL